MNANHPQDGKLNLALHRLGLFLGELCTEHEPLTPTKPKKGCDQYVPPITFETWFGRPGRDGKRGGRFWPWRD